MLKKAISFLLATALLTSFAFAANFTDFPADHWAAGYVEKLVADGTIGGYEDGTFRPNGTVTRAEFVKMIGKSDVKFETEFKDIAGHWAYDYIMYSGLDGDADGNFNPDVAITRNDVANLLWKRAGSKTGYTVDASITSQGSNPEAIAWIYASNIMIGDERGMRLSDTLSRAEASKLIVVSKESATGSDSQGTASSENELYLKVFNMTNLLLKKYDATATINHGELSMAALRLYNNEWDVAYYNLGDVVGKQPFDHPDALAFWLIGRDVLGADVVTEAIIDTPISVGDAIKVLSYYSERKDYDKRSINQEILLPGVDRSANITHKDFAQLITEIDNQIGMMVKTVVNSGNSAKKLATPLRRDVASYPSTENKFQVILENVPNSVYETAYDISTGSLKANYEFSREMPSFFLNPIHEFCQIAAANGAEIQISYFPSLCLEKDDRYTMRVELEVLSVSTAKNLKDICKTSVDRPIKAGDKFFCDLNSNAKIPSTSINGGVMSIDKIID